MSLSTVVVSQSGVLRVREVPSTTFDPSSFSTSLEAITKSTGEGPIKLVGSYPEHHLLLYGWTAGKHSKINKHEFPPPYDTDLFYGDIVVVQMNSHLFQLKSLSLTEYKDKYETLFGGFESLGSEDTEYDEDECSNEADETKDDPDYQPGDSDYDRENENDEEQEHLLQSENEEYTEESEGEWDFEQSDSN